MIIKKYNELLQNETSEKEAYCYCLRDLIIIDQERIKCNGLSIDSVSLWFNEDKQLVFNLSVTFFPLDIEKSDLSYRRVGSIHIAFYDNSNIIIQEEEIHYNTIDLPCNGTTSTDYESHPFKFDQPLDNIEKIMITTNL
ncbi:MAG: hypothetical protein KBT20_03195 [Bacteroidales bacterium]|nr:hypothetical protein [Candidatus Liminaster caballi]